jgi:hypothetical protein
MISAGPLGEDEADVDLVASLFILIRALLDIRDGESRLHQHYCSTIQSYKNLHQDCSLPWTKS